MAGLFERRSDETGRRRCRWHDNCIVPMAAPEGNDMDMCGEETRALIAGDTPLEGSFIDLIVAASE
jgi:hypothetical protein